MRSIAVSELTRPSGCALVSYQLRHSSASQRGISQTCSDIKAKVINLNSSNGTIFIRRQNLLNYKGRNLKSDVALPGVQRMGVIPEDGGTTVGMQTFLICCPSVVIRNLNVHQIPSLENNQRQLW